MTASDRSLFESMQRSAWRARLALGYRREADRSVLIRREHEGPLAVQKSLYPEGGICHNFVLHPPAGVAGGDELDIRVHLDEAAHAVLSTPGAGKWYRSAGTLAQQRLHFELNRGAMLEWLPQETILYSGAQAALHTRIDLASEAVYLGWEITCLGRPASGEVFAAGTMKQYTEIYAGDRLLWNEQGSVSGSDPLFNSAVGLRGCSINATMIAAGKTVTPDLLTALRVLHRDDALLAVTALDNVLLLRHLGHSAQAARELFAACRQTLRPWLCGIDAQSLRIWRT